MSNSISRVVAVLCLATVLPFGSPMGQEPLDQVAPVTERAMVEVISVDALFDSSRERLRNAAEAGDGAASLAMARSLFSDPDPQRQTEGVPYLESAAEAGIREAIEQLGDIYAGGGYGVVPDPTRARDAYERAVKAGSLDALVSLGQLLLNTEFTPEGQKRGLDMLVRSADAGQVGAANLLAQIYLNGLGVEADVDKALQYFSIGLVTGNGGAVLALGDALRVGTLHLAANPAVAMELFQGAADKGDIGASRRIASMYLNGEAVAQDIARGEQMLTDLAAAGDAQSLVELGDLYRDGNLVVADAAKAVGFYERSADLGYNTARIRLATIYLNGASGIAINVRRSLDYYNEAVDSGSTNAMRALAEMYLAGTVLSANPQEAIELLERAVTVGDSTAAERLAVLYAQNDPFPADYGQVKKYLDLSLAMGNKRAVISVASAIAEGPLARPHRDAAFSLLNGAVASRVPGAAARLAQLQLDGLFPAQGLNGVISMLNAEARRGDRASARFLLQLYRDGYGLLLQPDLDAAEAFLTSVEPALGEEVAAIERINLAAQRGESIETLEEISAQFDRLSKGSVAEALNDLRRENARAYVYVVQVRLQARGIYTGALNGTLDSATIRAFQAACAEADAARICAPGPLTAGTAQILANFMWGVQG
jgi:TPR repeat protein